MTVLWPAVKDRLVVILNELPAMTGVKVYDGPAPTSAAPPAWVTVGWQPSTEDASAGSYVQNDDAHGFACTEVGNVLLEFASTTGGSTMPSAFEQVAALRAAVQDDPSLGGVLTGAPTVSLTVEVDESQNSAGAAQRLRVGLDYTARVA